MGKFATLTKGEIADAFGVSLPTVESWIRKGLPAKKVANRWCINLSDATAWRIQQMSLPEVAGSLEDEKTRLTKAQADLAELELSEERGELVRMSSVSGAWESHVARCRARLLSLPTKASPQVVGCSSLAEVKAVLDGFVEEALLELAADDTGGDRDEDDTEGLDERAEPIPSSAAPVPVGVGG